MEMDANQVQQILMENRGLKEMLGEKEFALRNVVMQLEIAKQKLEEAGREIDKLTSKVKVKKGKKK